mgnify:CR=1 FL=1
MTRMIHLDAEPTPTTPDVPNAAALRARYKATKTTDGTSVQRELDLSVPGQASRRQIGYLTGLCRKAGWEVPFVGNASSGIVSRMINSCLAGLDPNNVNSQTGDTTFFKSGFFHAIHRYGVPKRIEVIDIRTGQVLHTGKDFKAASEAAVHLDFAQRDGKVYLPKGASKLVGLPGQLGFSF